MLYQLYCDSGQLLWVLPKKQFSQKRRTTRKRRSRGNQYINYKKENEFLNIPSTSCRQQGSTDGDDHDGDSVGTNNILTPTASASKIDLSFYNSDHNETVETVNNDESVNTTPTSPTSPNIDIRCIYIFADLKILLNLFGMVGRCPECYSGNRCCYWFRSKKRTCTKHWYELWWGYWLWMPLLYVFIRNCKSWWTQTVWC